MQLYVIGLAFISKCCKEDRYLCKDHVCVEFNENIQKKNDEFNPLRHEIDHEGDRNEGLSTNIY